MKKVSVIIFITLIIVSVLIYKINFNKQNNFSEVSPAQGVEIKKVTGTGIDGIYGLGLIVDTTDENNLGAIQNTVDLWNQKIGGEPEQYFFRDSDGTLLAFGSYILITENTAPNIKAYFQGPTLKGTSILWFEGGGRDELLSDRIINWMSENGVAKVWLVYNYENAIPDNMEEKFLELEFE